MRENAKNILILAAGEARPRPLLRHLGARADWVIAADGGVRLARQAHISVDQFVGDGDSLTRRQRCWLEDMPFSVTWHPVEKDETDLELALDLALALEPEQINIFGGWGLRADHTLSNVSLLERAAHSGIQTTLWAGWERLRVYLPGLHYLTKSFEGQRVSLIPLSDAVEDVITTGLRYPLREEKLFRAASRGLSNEVVDTTVSVQFSKGILLGIQAYGRRRLPFV